MAKIGFLGLGEMGTPMAGRLLHAAVPDHHVVTRLQQSAGHRSAHLTNPEESDLRHVRNLLP